MRHHYCQNVEDFLSDWQIKKYHLEGCYASYSLLAADKSKMMGVVDKDLVVPKLGDLSIKREIRWRLQCPHLIFFLLAFDQSKQ